MPRTSQTTAAALSAQCSRCSFLYQTKTILQSKSGLTHARRLITTKSNSQHASHSTTDNAESSLSNSFLKEKAASVASNKSRLGSSVTSAEQAAFDRIWAMFEKSGPSTTKITTTPTNYTDTDYRRILELFSPQREEFQSTVTIDDSVVDEASPSQAGHHKAAQAVSSGTDAGPRSQSSSQLNRKGAMAEIKGFLKDATSPSSTFTQLSEAPNSHNSVHSTALAIVEEVAKSLVTALSSKNPRPDLALWNVAEEKIFPMIKLLRPSVSSLSSPTPAESVTALNTDQDPNNPRSPEPSDAHTRLHPQIPSNVPLLPLLSQTYPSLTLLILRLYATHQPASPYALALLPTLKSLGPTSYVLGAHTHFYNTLLSLVWRIYSDLRGMNDLLVEMDTNGVEFDVGTWEVIRAIGEDRQKDMDGEGERGALWWNRMEQVTWWEHVGVEWKEEIKSRLGKKGISIGEVMREEADSQSDLATGQDTSEYVVTL